MKDYRCSFCGKSKDQVRKLIAGGGPNRPFICDECIKLCNEIIDEDAAGAPRPTTPAPRRAGWRSWLRRLSVALPR